MGYKIVCIGCRITFNRDIDDDVNLIHRCPECKKVMVPVSQKFLPPKRLNTNKWESVACLIHSDFFSINNKKGVTDDFYKTYPANYMEAVRFVGQYRAPAKNATDEKGE